MTRLGKNVASNGVHKPKTISESGIVRAMNASLC